MAESQEFRPTKSSTSSIQRPLPVLKLCLLGTAPVVAMLSFELKEKILFKAGVRVPPFPSRRLPIEDRYLLPNARVPQEQIEADTELHAAIAERKSEIEAMFVAFVAERAAKSLRDAESADTLQDLQKRNLRQG